MQQYKWLPARLGWIAFGLLIMSAVGWFGVRGVRREVRLCQLLCHEIERSAAPDELVVVDHRALRWCLMREGSMEMRRKVVFVEEESKMNSLLSIESANAGEFLLVTTESDSLLGRMRASGWQVREAKGGRPAFGLGQGEIGVFFVVRP